jgi:hypothetical protein
LRRRRAARRPRLLRLLRGHDIPQRTCRREGQRRRVLCVRCGRVWTILASGVLLPLPGRGRRGRQRRRDVVGVLLAVDEEARTAIGKAAYSRQRSRPRRRLRPGAGVHPHGRGRQPVPALVRAAGRPGPGGPPSPPPPPSLLLGAVSSSAAPDETRSPSIPQSVSAHRPVGRELRLFGGASQSQLDARGSSNMEISGRCVMLSRISESVSAHRPVGRELRLFGGVSPPSQSHLGTWTRAARSIASHDSRRWQ